MAAAALLDQFSTRADPRRPSEALCAMLACVDDSWGRGGLRDDAPDIVATDGKTSRQAHRGDGHPLHSASAWATCQRVVLGWQAVGSKSNEIMAIPILLGRLQLAGALVTLDATACRTRIARTMLDRCAR